MKKQFLTDWELRRNKLLNQEARDRRFAIVLLLVVTILFVFEWTGTVDAVFKSLDVWAG